MSNHLKYPYWTNAKYLSSETKFAYIIGNLSDKI